MTAEAVVVVVVVVVVGSAMGPIADLGPTHSTLPLLRPPHPRPQPVPSIAVPPAVVAVALVAVERCYTEV